MEHLSDGPVTFVFSEPRPMWPLLLVVVLVVAAATEFVRLNSDTMKHAALRFKRLFKP